MVRCVSLMPSQQHEALIALFRNRPDLAAVLAKHALNVTLPPYAEARIESAELTDVQPTEYRADLVVLLYNGKPVYGIVLEVQLSIDNEKLLSWPVYAVTLRARMQCPVALLVVTPHDRVARWACRTIELGGGNVFVPWVVGPSGVPEVLEPAQAASSPELAVLSAMAHGKSTDVHKAVRISIVALFASQGLDADRAMLYCDLVLDSLGEAARESLQAMDPAKYEFQSEFARRFLSQGRAEGEARGRAEALLKLLTLRFAPVSDVVAGRVRAASIEDLERWTERVLSAATVDDVLI
jgi:hypothetical protein